MGGNTVFQKWFLLIILLVPFLQGCAAAVVGATVGGTAVVLDNREVNQQIDDTGLRLRASSAFRESNAFDDQRVKFVVYNGDILLYGQAANEDIARQAERQARDIEGVVRVYNQIRIDDVANLVARADDTWITTRVKALLLRDQEYDISGIKVITENNEVFLLGIVDRESADRAIDIARNVRGVNKVIDVLTIR
ncbi:BON domain-containing protein [Aliidiomarina iranensis]|uniref:BON domain-containing protein n=1 Tax=Aliidiomarina iranensis TaxID=1434071 RepID=A0A432W2R9_9GAMM|nr:BON domain-containing protein [Aliidiomarina iranensis]